MSIPTIKSLSLKAANIPLNRIVVGKVGKFENKMSEADPFIRGLLNMFAGSIRELTDNFIRELNRA